MKQTLKIGLACAVLIVSLASCTDDFFDSANLQDPPPPSDTRPPSLPPPDPSRDPVPPADGDTPPPRVPCSC